MLDQWFAFFDCAYVGVRSHLGVDALSLARGDRWSLMGPNRRNVLIVDDDDDIRSLIRYWLSDDPRCGMIWEATDPLTAAGLSVLLPVDVVIIDFVLGNHTASDCLSNLRESRPDARIIVYTANIEVAKGADVLRQGADQLVEKG